MTERNNSHRTPLAPSATLPLEGMSSPPESPLFPPPAMMWCGIEQPPGPGHAPLLATAKINLVPDRIRTSSSLKYPVHAMKWKAFSVPFISNQPIMVPILKFKILNFSPSLGLCLLFQKMWVGTDREILQSFWEVDFFLKNKRSYLA